MGWGMPPYGGVRKRGNYRYDYFRRYLLKTIKGYSLHTLLFQKYLLKKKRVQKMNQKIKKSIGLYLNSKPLNL